MREALTGFVLISPVSTANENTDDSRDRIKRKVEVAITAPFGPTELFEISHANSCTSAAPITSMGRSPITEIKRVTARR